jgi:hypothetical protein
MGVSRRKRRSRATRTAFDRSPERELEAARKLADAQRERAEQAEKAKRLEEERAQEAEKRAKEQKESANKLHRHAFVTAGAAVAALILLLVSVVLWRASLSARAVAEEQAKIANEQRITAQAARVAAEEQTRIAESRRLATESSSALTKYPQRSLLLLAAEAVKVGQPERVVAAEQSLRQALDSVGGRPL